METGPTTEFKRYQFSITVTGEEARRIADWLDDDEMPNRPSEVTMLRDKFREVTTR